MILSSLKHSNKCLIESGIKAKIGVKVATGIKMIGNRKEIHGEEKRKITTVTLKNAEDTTTLLV